MDKPAVVSDAAMASTNKEGEVLDMLRELLSERRDDAVVQLFSKLVARNSELEERLADLLQSRRKNEGVSSAQLQLFFAALGEEMGINEALETAGVDVLETDLGEYIIQLAHEPPSHIIAPAIHKTKAQITELFHQHHSKLGRTERVTEVADIVSRCRRDVH